MLDNKYRCEHVLPLYRSEATTTVEGLKFYLETLESGPEDRLVSLAGRCM